MTESEWSPYVATGGGNPSMGPPWIFISAPTVPGSIFQTMRPAVIAGDRGRCCVVLTLWPMPSWSLESNSRIRNQSIDNRSLEKLLKEKTQVSEESRTPSARTADSGVACYSSHNSPMLTDIGVLCLMGTGSKAAGDDSSCGTYTCTRPRFLTAEVCLGSHTDAHACTHAHTHVSHITVQLF